MGYLICQKCGGYYKLAEGESKDDFVSCECYGSLTYVDSIDEYLEENHKFNKDLSEDKKSEYSDVEVDHNVKSDIFVPDSDLKNGFEDESPQNEKLSKSSSFPSFTESEDIPSVKNRKYYREISSKDIKPDIEKLKRIKDVNGIIEALNYNDHGVKLEAVQALGALGDERALEYLEDLRNEEKGILKTYAENAIFHIESKNKGFKSKNRAYYREEYYKGTSRNKETSRKFDENKLIDQSSKPINNAFIDDASIDDLSTDNASIGDLSTDNAPIDDASIDQVSIDKTINKINEKTSVKKSNIFNSVSKTQNISETVTIQKTTQIPAKTDDKLFGDADGKSYRIVDDKLPGDADGKSHGIADVKAPVKNHNNELMTKKISKLLAPPEIVKKDLPKKTTPKIDDIKKINENEGTGNEDIYFIQFLGIKKTDKPLIIFIFLFTVILIMGVILTMGYK